MRGFIIAAAAFAFAVAAAPATADDLEQAKKAVGAASDEQLLAEFQRRYDARKSKANKATRTRDLTPAPRAASPLGGADEATLVHAARLTARTIYGTDDRKDFFQVTDDGVISLARASVALFTADKAPATGAAAVSLKTKSLREVQRLCPGERYEGQPSGAYCSGTLVAPDTVLTAGHCVRELSGDDTIGMLPDTRFVFGYWMKDAATPPGDIPAEQVFAGKEVLGGEASDARDWALIRLDRAVPETIAKPVVDWTLDPVQKGQKVFVIGFPSGIPLKYAPGANVRDDSKPGFFVADLDSFGGNSGSGVYDQATKKLIGILVRGDTDYLEDRAKRCWRVHMCPRGCRGEDVTRISIVQVSK
jgi:V8-like Glu-specific endopeptidase